MAEESAVIRVLVLGLLLLLAASVHAQTMEPKTLDPADFDEAALKELLLGDSNLAEVAKETEKYRLQVLVGLIHESADGQSVLRQVSFRAGTEYFYPASAIKLFAAVVALEKLSDLRQKTGLPLDVDTGLIFHPRFADETLADKDPSNLDGQRITLRHEIRKLFLVSDNQAFNRLYEWVGQSRLNRRLHEVGLKSAQIIHRLSVARTPLENLQSPKIELVGESFRHELPSRTSSSASFSTNLPGQSIGKAYLSDGERQNRAMDFRLKNRMSLKDMQLGLCKVVRPDIDAGGEGFKLTDEQRELLLEAMTQLPRQSRNPVYDPAKYPDDHVKFLRPGLLKIVPAEHLMIANKIGRAYGFSVENAWVVDTKTDRSFFLAATLYTNEDGVLNDDQYEYETIADPFLASLGRAVAKALWDPASTSGETKP